MQNSACVGVTGLKTLSVVTTAEELLLPTFELLSTQDLLLFVLASDPQVRLELDLKMIQSY